MRVIAGALAVLIACTRGETASAGASGADSVSFRAEVGTAVDASNELFYEQTYTDTTFLGRRLHGTPEQHVAAVALVEWLTRSSDRRWDVALRPEVTLGDEMSRGATTAAFRFRPDDRWRLSLEPRLELVHDRRFDLDRHEVLYASTFAARRRIGSSDDLLTLRLGGEGLRTAGSDDPFLLAHRLGRGSVAWDHDGLLGLGWSARYEADWRTFPDSISRDHIEQQFEGTLHQEFLGGHSLALGSALVRRVAQHPVTSTRDCFTQPRGELSGTLRFGDHFTTRAAATAEWTAYDWPDSLDDFNYGLARAELQLRREFGTRLAVSLVPQVERLGTSWAPAERYDEHAVSLEAEWLDPGSWWLFEPAAGVRHYDHSESGETTNPAAIHSSYRFLELQLMGDQAVPGRLRARLSLHLRDERHDDPSQDSRSLYFSFDLRRLF